MGNLGYLLFQSYRFEEAIYWLQPAYDLFVRIGATNAATATIGNLGWCYLNLGDSEKALAAFDDATARSIRANDLPQEQSWLGNSGSVYLMPKIFPLPSIDTVARWPSLNSAKTGLGALPG